MDDPLNQGMPASPLGGPGLVPPPPPPPMGRPMGGPGDDPHEKIIAALTRIEEKLAVIAAKVGA